MGWAIPLEARLYAFPSHGLVTRPTVLGRRLRQCRGDKDRSPTSSSTFCLDIHDMA